MYSNWKMFNHIEWRRLAIWQTKFRDLSSTNKDLHREERFQALLLGYHDNEQTSYNKTSILKKQNLKDCLVDRSNRLNRASRVMAWE